MSYVHTDQLVAQTGDLDIAASGSKGQPTHSSSSSSSSSVISPGGGGGGGDAAVTATLGGPVAPVSSSGLPGSGSGSGSGPDHPGACAGSDAAGTTSSAVPGRCAAAQPSPEIAVDLGTGCAVDATSPFTASPRQDGVIPISFPVSAAAAFTTAETHVSLAVLPNEILLHILGFLDVSDLLSTSRTSHHLRQLSLAPILHAYRLRHTRAILPPLLTSPSRPSLADLIARSIFLTHTSVVSRRLARSLVSISLARRLAVRPAPEILVERCVLPKECVPGMTGVHVAPALVARRKTIERERVKDGLRRWVAQVWKGEVRERSEGIKMAEERVGVGRVWRLRRFWERVGRGHPAAETIH